MATEAQIAANRANGLLGGVTTVEGKAISRLNARKHGIFASALTTEDARELRGIEGELAAELSPIGLIEEILVEKLAVTYLRMQRCARVEAEHYKTWRLESLARARAECEKKLEAFGMHDVRLTNQFLRLLREFKGMQKERTLRNSDPSFVALRATSEGEGGCGTRNGESTTRNERQEEMENEPNSASEHGRSNNVNTPNKPADVDSRLRGNDNEGVKKTQFGGQRWRTARDGGNAGFPPRE